MTDDSRQEDGPEWAVTWCEVGRDLLTREVTELRFDLEEAFYDVEEVLREGNELTHDHVHALRVALNRARERVENQVAPVADAKPWGGPPPRIPMGELWELTDHPNAEGVDPHDYIDGASASEETDQQ